MYMLPELDHGLNSKQTKSRLEHFGPNQFDEKKVIHPGRILLSQFQSPLVYVLLIAGFLTFVLGEWLDSLVILLVVTINSLLGFYQEYKTSRALEALREYLKPTVEVIRNSQRQQIQLKDLVPGDIVLINTGESIPADGVFISNQLLSVNEAVLTGESMPVTKQATKLTHMRSLGEVATSIDINKQAQFWGFMGTTVRSGYGKMLVLKTGYNTRMGQIAHRLSETTQEKTPLQEQLAKLATRLMYIVGIITGGLFVLGISRGVSWLDMLMTSVAVAVAAIPEGLVIAMTVILALGMQRIFQRKALVRNLVAAETLGSVSVICADKTGTLTQGKMEVTDYQGRVELMIRSAILVGDDRDEESRAMSLWAQKYLNLKTITWTQHQKVSDIRDTYVRLKSIPFDSSYKYAASLNHGPRQSYISLAGAPEKVLERVNLSSGQRQTIEKDLARFAKQGYRLIALAGAAASGTKATLTHKDLAKLDWYGFLAFSDPLRPKVRRTLSLAGKAGVSVKVITGDYKETSIAVLTSALGHLAETSVITGDELAQMTETELLERIDSLVLFARTTPEQKLAIVKALKQTGQVVAMTGDGVNDAPALKAADIGIVVNEATDVSKQTADMVLLDSNIESIVAAIKEGRGIYASIRKVTGYLLADTFQELVLIGFSLFLGLPLPVTAAQILWINLVQDSFLGISLAFEKSDKNLMRQPPRKRKQALIDKEMLSLIGVIVLISNLGLIFLYIWYLRAQVTLIQLQTMVFAAMSTNSLFYIFSVKSLKKNIWQINPLNNLPLLAAVGLGFALTWGAIYLPILQSILGTVALTNWELLVIMMLGLSTTAVIEAAKWFKNR